MTFATGLSNPEGPVALADGSWLVVEGGATRGCVSQISADGRTRREIRKTGRPNGLAIDSQGVIWVAESKTPSLIRLTMEGALDVVATECDGEPFLFPNDLCFGPDGAIYMTDSGVFIDDLAPNNQVRPDYLSLRYDGRVYRVNVSSGQVRKLDSGLQFTNGIAFGPDKSLYVNETISGNIYRYPSGGNGGFKPKIVFGNVIRPDAPPSWKGPDGMAFGTDGSLYVAVFGQGDVTVLGEDGAVLRRIPTAGNLPTNVAFSLAGRKRIHVTEYELGQMEAFDVATDGLPLFAGSRTT
jgi:gluconolactonase